MKRVISQLLILSATIFFIVAFGFLVESRLRFLDSSTVYKNTYDSPQQFMEGIYAADHASIAKDHGRIRGVIVPHHLTANASIAAGIKSLEQQTFKKILLISPDHFHQCPTILCTTNAIYQTFFGDTHSSPEILSILRSSPLVTNDPKLFKTEHGVYAVVPFIVHDRPDVSVTPLVFSQDLPWNVNREQILDLIKRAVDDETIVVVSSDFSHYLPLATAQEMDTQTIKTLFDQDLDGLSKLKNPSQSDCPNCLWTLASLAKDRQFYNPQILHHTNSAELLNDLMVQSTTSHYSIIWEEEKEK